MGIDWKIKGRQFGNCNCNYGCPCQFNAPPTDNYCHGMGAFLIDEGFFDKVDLEGVKAVSMMKFPGPIHEGDGEMQIILDLDETLINSQPLDELTLEERKRFMRRFKTHNMDGYYFDAEDMV